MHKTKMFAATAFLFLSSIAYSYDRCNPGNPEKLTCESLEDCMEAGGPDFSTDGEAIVYHTKALYFWEPSDGTGAKAEIYHERANNYLYCKEYDNAVADFKKAVEFSEGPNSKGYYYAELGWAYLLMGECEKAGINLKKADQLVKADASISRILYGAYWWYCKKDRKKAFEYLKIGVLNFKPKEAATIRTEGLKMIFYKDEHMLRALKGLSDTPEFKKLLADETGEKVAP